MKFEKTEVFDFEGAKPIKGIQGYFITEDGSVFNKKGLKLKQVKSKNGYMRVSLHHIHYLVHRLVANTFIENPLSLPQGNHKNEIRDDNRVENLEWISCKDNLNYSHIIEKASIAKFQKVKCKTTGEVFNCIKSACKKYGLHHSNIVVCCKGRRKNTKGFEWEYIA